MIVGYKGIADDGASVSSGTQVVRVDGVEHTGRIPNPVGALIEMDRIDVDANRNNTCSNGLHVGTYSYASRFGAVLVRVLVDPCDIVEVPRDQGGRKMRVCRYRVIEVRDDEITEPVWSPPSHRRP